MKDMITSLQNIARISLISDLTSDALDILPLVDEAIPVNYTYEEGISYFNEMLRILKLRNDLRKIRVNGGITINNHPNIFLKKGNLNVLHGFSFLDFIIDESGHIRNKVLFSIIKLSNVYRIYNNGNFLANSNYTKGLSLGLFKKLGLKPSSIEVLYPTFHTTYKISQKNRGILSFQRINKEKKLEVILDVARNSNQHFIIAGAVNEGDQQYLRSLIRNKPDNVKIIPNPSEAEKENLFLNSKVYLHLNRKEHFGISLVESMSHGLMPVVPKSGGPWVDIVKEGKYGYGYSDLEEIPDSLSLALASTEEKQRDIIESTKRFSYENFSEKLRCLINSMK